MSGDAHITEMGASTGSFWKSCYTCRDYALARREVIAVPLGDKARREGRDVIEVVDEFMAAAHRRHLNGEPLRPGGPTRIGDPALGRLAALFAPRLLEGEPGTKEATDA